MTFGGCFGPVYNFKITWYDAEGKEYVGSSVPDSYEPERYRETLRRIVDSLQARCLTVSMLLESLRDEDPCMRNFALSHIKARVQADREYLSLSDGVLPALHRMLDDQEALLRIMAARCLYMLFDETHAYCEQATEVLLHIVKTGGRWERSSAISALFSSPASKSNDVVDALLVALRDEYKNVRYAAAGALRHYRNVPQRAEDIFAGLTEALGDEDEGVRILAAGSLKEFE